ncbi:hypothetical protein UFOVP470_7 [uncultured Caudovirales phage]|uniref:Uncharacterized protein n=1 Tax=uncultured Caudovirales phage TaxID=2100421 RepID=A0A6J5MFZ5_9CAUD|nr:hypothetical protein UFOVP470_7 [uncultured Caudovirales phage]
MTTKDRIFEAVQARLGGATESFLENEYNDAVMEYFQRSTVFRFRQDITLRSGKTSYPLTIPSGAHLSQILFAGDTSSQLRAVPSFVQGMAGADIMTFDGASNILRLREAPSEERIMTILLILSPERGAIIPEYLLLQEYEGLKDLLLSRMYAIPQRPWTSEKLAGYHGKRAVRAISEAQRIVNRGYGSANWSFPAFT